MVTALAARLSVPIATLTMADIKQTLRKNTVSAAGVFGVPSLLINGELFWSVDGLDFAKAYLADPSILASGEMQRISPCRSPPQESEAARY
ncbi:hypothetical protein [Nevskia ramosa]|uniref:hypothetical protein n=1 Tax=Nevskia ramosa TaxID=64002 RepID=UPI003D0A1AE5